MSKSIADKVDWELAGPRNNARIVPLTWAGPPHNQFKKNLGTKVGKDKRVKPRVFWLGKNYDQAQHLVKCYQVAWGFRRLFNTEHWTDELERLALEAYEDEKLAAKLIVNNACERILELQKAGIPIPASDADAPPAFSGNAGTSDAAQQPRVARGRTLKAAAERYLDTLRAKQLTPKYVGRCEQAFKQLFKQLPETTPIDSLDREKLVAVVGHFLARPASKSTEKRLAVASIRTLFQHTKALLTFLEDEGWDARGWRRLFKVRWASLLSADEQRKQAGGKDTFTFAELKELYDLANDRQRMLMLLALNTAMNQKELSTLQRADVNLNTGRVSRIRNKTRATAAVKVEWQLWPETLELLKKFFAPENELGLALMTEDLNPLVNDATDTDAVALTWTRLLKKAVRENKAVRTLPFGTLRKTSATWVRNHAGESIQQMHLGHASQTVAKLHYTGAADFKPLDMALEQYRSELLAAGVMRTGQP